MKITVILIIVAIGLISCESDNFHDVTKKMTAPDRIEINKPFEFAVGLVNQTNKPIKLTLDRYILKSLFFRPSWSCGKERIIHRTPNPKEQSADYNTIFLQPKDSISFPLTAKLISYSNDDSLKFVIDGYEKDFRLANPRCSDFDMRFEGMWLPGDRPIGDSMEGYNFQKDIKIE